MFKQASWHLSCFASNASHLTGVTSARPPWKNTTPPWPSESATWRRHLATNPASGFVRVFRPWRRAQGAGLVRDACFWVSRRPCSQVHASVCVCIYMYTYICHKLGNFYVTQGPSIVPPKDANLASSAIPGAGRLCRPTQRGVGHHQKPLVSNKIEL